MKRRTLTSTSGYKLSHTPSCEAMKITYKVQEVRNVQVGGWRWEDGWKQGQPKVLGGLT